MTHAENLQLLFTILSADEVDWEDLEDALVQFPGWLAILRSRRYPDRPMDNRIFWAPVSFEFGHVSKDSLKWLQDFFRPFAIITDPSTSVSDKINLLNQAQIDPLVFCTEHANDGIAVVADGARDIVEAIRGKSNLLRGHQPPLNSSDLVRPSTSMTGDDNKLLRSSEQVETAPTPSRIGWIQRMLGRN